AVGLAVGVLVLVVDDLLGPLAVFRDHIANGNHLHFRKAQEATHVAGALTTAADGGHRDSLVCDRAGLTRRSGCDEERPCGNSSGFEEIAAGRVCGHGEAPSGGVFELWPGMLW